VYRDDVDGYRITDASLQYMGRENLEDYDAAFLIQLETREAAIKSELICGGAEKNHQPIEIATLLGWTRRRSDDVIVLDDTARACQAAYAPIETAI
jgi:hypothetical protein